MRRAALILSFPLLVVMACSAWAEPKALVLGVDGCRPDALAIADTPYLDALATSGAASYDARNTMTHGSSGPNWSSAMTGVDVPKHGVTSNSWNTTNGFVGNHFDQYPHMFSYLETLDPSLYTASFAGWPPINPGTWANRFGDETQALGQSGNTARVVDLLTNADPDVIFIQMEGVDSAGHADAFSPISATYLAAIEKADTDVGSMLTALYSRPGYIDGSEDWLILAVTDHGGKGNHHDLPSGGEEVYRTFYIAAGDSVTQGADLGTPRIFDVAPTVLNHMGVDISTLNLDGHVTIPEPSSVALLLSGLCGLGLFGWRRRRRSARDDTASGLVA